VSDIATRHLRRCCNCGFLNGIHLVPSSHDVAGRTTDALQPHLGKDEAMSKSYYAESVRDILLLIARILLMLLFLIFGWRKLTDYGGTVAYFAQGAVPLPALAGVIAIVAELGAGIAISLGIVTRPVAVLLALYTFATALLGHHFWTMEGPARAAGEINFFKNMSIMGGLVLLYLTGAGRYSIDNKMNMD
jgi:putative oxidoreductase